jgi:hypothetical protein
MNEELHHVEGAFALGVKDSSVESPKRHLGLVI